MHNAIQQFHIIAFIFVMLIAVCLNQLTILLFLCGALNDESGVSKRGHFLPPSLFCSDVCVLLPPVIDFHAWAGMPHPELNWAHVQLYVK